jgi:hypothetical protein
VPWHVPLAPNAVIEMGTDFRIPHHCRRPCRFWQRWLVRLCFGWEAKNL